MSSVFSYFYKKIGLLQTDEKWSERKIRPFSSAEWFPLLIQTHTCSRGLDVCLHAIMLAVCHCSSLSLITIPANWIVGPTWHLHRSRFIDQLRLSVYKGHEMDAWWSTVSACVSPLCDDPSSHEFTILAIAMSNGFGLTLSLLWKK